MGGVGNLVAVKLASMVGDGIGLQQGCGVGKAVGTTFSGAVMLAGAR
jgi:hypothetical protein